MPSVSDIKDAMLKGFQPTQASGVNATIQFDLGGEGEFYVIIKDGTVEANEGKADSPNMTLISTAEDYFNVATGKLNPMQAFMSGKIKVTGDMGLAMKLQSMFKAS
jgi:putative sterol carrier protein